MMQIGPPRSGGGGTFGVTRGSGPARSVLVRWAALVLAAALVLLPRTGPLRRTEALGRTEATAGLRAAERDKVLLGVRAWPHLQYPRFTVYYAPGLARDAAVVAAAASTYLPEVLADYGLTGRNVHAILVVCSPAQMSRYTGEGAADPPLGAYYEGVVWLLAPSAFLPAGAGLAKAYARQGPVAHELTHLADDLASGGRTPPWLDEGLAQYEDWRLTGYVWTQADNGFGGATYTWKQLTQNFDGLGNVALAYRQALAATADICRTGPGTCVQILARLRQGEPLDQALRAAVGGATLADLEHGSAWRPGTAPQPGTPAGPQP